ncbi:signal peptidase I [Solemya velum gill symbiont]|uniref:Signal peptidase I n=1 Tax=Solemya velum gill symbiont TaxID=2340 RepID=A0A1T2DJM8_SOVGS|nr:signal peptidase I [Solemya velum gill symbiont]OOY34944.1 signal peptidase I [Solemya velum gill symbiont]OOY37303.1 signal peptidase I [Solemya velum gill symbiont]OOY39368.1 signal peptidase I [Solemya velum gill symbiont]OOY42309.1 signal peptidase I [Solemya velum gill symbiont]OOY43977.1 signal peptidase I [Solemya velum gill symbiont]
MSFDIETVLVLVVVVMGVVWLLDRLYLRKRRKKDVKEPFLVDLSHSLLPVFLIVLILRSFVFEPFRIPSGSMMPTLLVGDFILVNKYAYGLRLPVSHSKIMDTGSPQRGDVVVFRFPMNDSIDYIKRVVAVPGDTVAYRDKILYINGQPQQVEGLEIYNGVGGGKRETGVLHASEKLDGVEHSVLINRRRPDFGPGCQVLADGPVRIPEGHYFAMGDNRGNSNDSRCWGLVPEKNLVGRASMIWMNFDSDLPGFPVEWSRIGETIK